jgi:hypothetical protein
MLSGIASVILIQLTLNFLFSVSFDPLISGNEYTSLSFLPSLQKEINSVVQELDSNFFIPLSLISKSELIISTNFSIFFNLFACVVYFSKIFIKSATAFLSPA